MKEALTKAYKEHYAVPQINVNGLIWIEGILLAAEKRTHLSYLEQLIKLLIF